MENKTPVPDEKKAKYDPKSGEVEPAPIEMEGARVMANEAGDELGDETPLDKDDVRQLAEDYVTRRGADDTENFKDYAEDKATGGEQPSRPR
ncbi:MAG: hypothetical protein QOE80_505 [Actinomycetota bacterium]|jgi:hypothetical protein|nr:hypothetical protein [Actinomycetota bacterium]